MTKQQLPKELLMATLIATLLFMILVVLSYLLTLEHRVNFSVGLPWKFYHQTLVNCEVQPSTHVPLLILDIVLLWLLTAASWIFLRRNKYL